MHRRDVRYYYQMGKYWFLTSDGIRWSRHHFISTDIILNFEQVMIINNIDDDCADIHSKISKERTKLLFYLQEYCRRHLDHF